MQLPVDIKAVIEEAASIDGARQTPLSVSVYVDDTAPGDVQAHVRQAFASASPHARVSLMYLEGRPFSPYVGDDMAVIVAGLDERVGECASRLREAGVPISLAPGACAFVSALVLSAFPADVCAFLGFLRGKASEKRAFLRKYAAFEGTLLFYSAPQDVDGDVALLYEAFGDRAACAVREITKLHEEVQPFRLAEGLAGEKRGEYVLVVEGAKRAENPLNALPVPEHIAHYTAQGMSEKDALKAAARDRGVPKNELYRYTMKDR